MPADQSQEFGFAEPDFDWSLYERNRPAYPDSFWQQVLEYHNSHSGRFDTALEVGAGYGVGTKDFLAKHFDHVFTTDPVAHNLEAANHYLNDVISQGKVTTLQAGAENSTQPENSVDMIMTLECLHWADPEKAIKAMSRQLQPGGTLAAVFYSQVSIVDNPTANEAWVRAFGKVHSIWSRKPGAEGLRNAWDGLNTILPLPAESFESGAKRIRLNADVLEAVGHRRNDFPFLLHPEMEIRPESSFVKDIDVLERRVDDDWSMEVGKEWFRESIISYQIPPDEVEEELRLVEAAVDEHGGGRAKVRWLVDIALATRR